MNKLLEIQNLSVSYGGNSALRSVSLGVEAGQVVCVVGESGSGKSTLLSAAMGLLPPDARVSGSVLYNGAAVLNARPSILRAWRGKEWGMVFQDAGASFDPMRTVAQQLAEMLKAHGAVWDALMQLKAASLLESMHVTDPERVLSCYPFELSGGQCQRVGIAAALLLDPKIVYADEPTSALDTVSQKGLVHRLRQFCENNGAALVLATHNMAAVRELGGEVLVLQNGAVFERGTAERMLQSPGHPYTADLVSAGNRLRGWVCADE